MTDLELTEEEWTYVSVALKIIAKSHPYRPNVEEHNCFSDLVDMGFSVAWITESIHEQFNSFNH